MSDYTWVIYPAAGLVLGLYLASLMAPTKYRYPLKAAAIVLATCGVGGLVLLLDRQRERRAVAISQAPDYTGTGADLEANDAAIEDMRERLGAVDGETYTDEELGADFARRLEKP